MIITFKNIFSFFTLVSIMICCGCTKIISGKIISSTDYTPIADCKVVLQNSRCMPSIIMSARTDKNGMFNLSIPWTISNCNKNHFVILITKDEFIQSSYTFDSKTGFSNNIIKIQPEDKK